MDNENTVKGEEVLQNTFNMDSLSELIEDGVVENESKNE